MSDIIDYLELKRGGVTTYYPHVRGTCGMSAAIYTADPVAMAKEITRDQITVPPGYIFRRRVCTVAPPLITAVYTYRYADGGLSVYVFGQTGQVLRSVLTRQSGATFVDTVAMNMGGWVNKALFPDSTPAPYGSTHHNIGNSTFVLTITDAGGTVLFTSDPFPFTDSQPTGQLTGQASTIVAAPRLLARVSLQPTDTGGGGGGDPFIDYQRNIRRFGLMPYVNARNPVTFGIPDYDEEMVRWSATTGRFNYFFPCQNVEYAENVDGSYDYRMLDANLALAHELNMPVMLLFDFKATGNHYVTDEEAMRDQTGAIHIRDSRRVASFCSMTARAKRGAHITAMLNHAKASPYAGMVLGVSIVNGYGFETEYAQKNGNEIPVVLDYSEPSRLKFIERMQAKYSTITAANTAWGTSFGSFGAVTLPVPQHDGGNDSLNWYYNTPMLRDFYNHRQLSLAEDINWWHDLVKGVSLKLKTMVKTGNLRDGQSSGRGTISIATLLRVDIIQQDNTPDYPLKLTAAIGSRDGRSDYGAGDEMFFCQDAFYSKDQQKGWMKGTYAGGAWIGDWAGFYQIGGGEGSQQQRDVSKAWMLEVMNDVHASYPIGAVVTRGTIEGTLSATSRDLLDYTWSNARNGQPSYEQQYNTLSAKGTKYTAIDIANTL